MTDLTLASVFPTDRLFDAACIFLFGLFLFNEFVKFRSDTETKDRLAEKEAKEFQEIVECEELDKPVSVGVDATTGADFPILKFLLCVAFAAVAWEYSGCFACFLKDNAKPFMKYFYGEVVEPMAEPVKVAVKEAAKVVKDIPKVVEEVAQSVPKPVKKAVKKVAKNVVKAAAAAAGVPVNAAGHKEL
jgi:hypothetical protein